MPTDPENTEPLAFEDASPDAFERLQALVQEELDAIEVEPSPVPDLVEELIETCRQWREDPPNGPRDSFSRGEAFQRLVQRVRDAVAFEYGPLE